MLAFDRIMEEIGIEQYLKPADGRRIGRPGYCRVNMLKAILYGFMDTGYGCSLYLFKRSEKYLMLFALYAGALALWFLPSICTIRTPFFRSVCYNSYNCAILLSILMCAQMSGIGRNSPVQLLYRWYAALPVCALIT